MPRFTITVDLTEDEWQEAKKCAKFRQMTVTKFLSAAFIEGFSNAVTERLHTEGGESEIVGLPMSEAQAKRPADDINDW